MDLFRRLFPSQKSATRGLFSFAFPQAPASLQNRNYLLAYRDWVYACVKRKADSAATMELTLQRKQNGEWKEVTSGPQLDALALLTRVNDHTTSDGLYRGISSFLDLLGNGFVYVAYNGKKVPSELWQLDPTQIEVIKSDSNYIAGWEYTNPKGKKIRLNTWEVIPFQEFNPRDQFRGLGPTEAAALPIDADRYTAEWKRNFFANSAIPAVAIKTKKNLTDEQYERLIQGWIARFQGVQNAHKPAVLEGETEVEVLNNSMKELDLSNIRREERDQILAIFGVPKVLLGIVEDVNRANAEASEYIFAKYTMAPRFRFIATVLSEFYLPMWKLDPTEYRLWAKDCVPVNDELTLKRRDTNLKNGTLTINEARAEDGLKPVEGGDTPMVSTTMQPLDLAINPPAPVLSGMGGSGESDQKPPKKSAKSAKPDMVDNRVKFIVEQINAAAPKFEAIYTDQQKALVAKMQSDLLPKSVSAENKKDIDETARSNELVRFLFADWPDWIGVLLEPTRDTLKGAFDEAGRRSLSELDIDQQFDQEHERALSWLETHALQHATSIADTVKDEVANLIIKAVKDGKGAEDIASDIKGYFTDSTAWKALRIARTEVITGYAEGSLEGFRQSGVVNSKQWLTAGDERVDPECQLNQDAGAVLLDLNFPTGHAAPPVHPNCRCVLQPVTT